MCRTAANVCTRLHTGRKLSTRLRCALGVLPPNRCSLRPSDGLHPLALMSLQARRLRREPPWPGARACLAPGVAWWCWRGPTLLPRAGPWAGRSSRRRWRSARSAWQLAPGWSRCGRACLGRGRVLTLTPQGPPLLSGSGMAGCRLPRWASSAPTTSSSRPGRHSTAEGSQHPFCQVSALQSPVACVHCELAPCGAPTHRANEVLLNLFPFGPPRGHPTLAHPSKPSLSIGTDASMWHVCTQDPGPRSKQLAKQACIPHSLASHWPAAPPSRRSDPPPCPSIPPFPCACHPVTSPAHARAPHNQHVCHHPLCIRFFASPLLSLCFKNCISRPSARAGRAAPHHFLGLDIRSFLQADPCSLPACSLAPSSLQLFLRSEPRSMQAAHPK